MEQPIYKTIKGGNQSILSYLLQVWQTRSLIFSFALRDLKVQYAQTYLGILWSVIQPLTGLLIFNFFFQQVIHLKLSVPYAVFSFTGIMGWFYFTSLIGQGGMVLVANQALIKKIHFPHLILLLSKTLVGLLEFGISLVLLLGLMLLTGCSFTSRILFLPLAIFANIVAGLSLGIWLSALTIRYRDLHHIIPYLVGFGIWLTPVFYPTTMLPEKFNWIYYFHPIANVISIYRYIFIGMPIDWAQLFCSLMIAVFLFISGLIYFIKNEKVTSDYL